MPCIHVNRRNTFRYEYKNCRRVLSNCTCPVLAMTATATEALANELQTSLGVLKFEKVLEVPNRLI